MFAEGHSIKAALVNGEYGDLAEMRERLRQAYIELYRKMLDVMANFLEALSPEQPTRKRVSRKLAWLLPCDDGTWSDQVKALEGAFEDVTTKRESVDDYRQPDAFARPGRNALHQAAQNGRDIELFQVIRDGKLDLNGKSAGGWTALMFASEGGHLKFVNLLLERKIDLYATNEAQYTALAIAAVNGYFHIVKAIIRHEREYMTNHVRLVNMKSRRGRTAFLDVAARGHTDIVKLLFEAGADLNQTSKQGWTALHLAAEMDRYETVRYLTEQGADRSKTILRGDRAGFTAMQVATGVSKGLLMGN